MKIKEIEKVTKEKIYVAADGKEFKNEADCKEWEDTYKFTVKQSFNKLPKLQVEGCEVAFPGSNNEDYIIVMEPKSLDDITIINAYIKSFVYDGGMYSVLDTSYLNQKIVINFGYNYGENYDGWDYYNCYTLDELREKYSKAQERIENAFTKCEPTDKVDN